MTSVTAPRLQWAMAAGVGALALTMLDLLSRPGFALRRSAAEWGTAILTVDGKLSLGEALSIYPVLPHHVATLGQLVAGNFSFEGPAIVSAMCLAFLAAWISTSLSQVRWPTLTAGAAALLLVTMAPVLGILAAGLYAILLSLLTALLTNALFRLRREGSVNSAMAAGFLLAALALTHSTGLLAVSLIIALLALAIPTDFFLRSSAGSLMVLLFPFFSLILGFAYIRWLFMAEPFSFLRDAFAFPITAQDPQKGISLWAHAVSSGLILVVPLIGVAAFFLRHDRRLLGPLAIAVSLPMGPAIWAALHGASISPEVFSALTLGAIAGIAGSGVFPRQSRMIVMALVTICWIGSHALSFSRSNPFQQKMANATTAEAESMPDAFAAGIASRGFQDVAVDAVTHPEFAAGRGTGEGLVLPNHSSFALMGALQRPNAAFIAVPDPERAGAGTDRLLRMFPTLYRDGFRGYQLRYSQNGWRIFERL